MISLFPDNAKLSLVPEEKKLKDLPEFYFERRWYAVHTRSRHEKIVASLIQKKDVEVYMPVRKVLKKWSDRKKLVESPLFSGYIFVHIPLVDKNQILHTKGVVRILGTVTNDYIPIEQIETLRHFENQEVEVDPYLHLQPGQEIRISRGPLRGCTGLLVRKKNKYRLVVNLKVLMQSASVEIDAEDIEPD